MIGLFNSTDTSFSYLQTSTTNVTVGSETTLRTELQSVTTLWINGRLVVMTVIEDHDSTEERTRLRDLTLEWLANYRSANPRRP